MSDVLFNSAYYQWQALLKFHSAVLSEIQDGNMKWGDDYHRLEQQMLMPFSLNKSKFEKKFEKPGKSRDITHQSNNYSSSDDRVVYCNEYQRKACTHRESHRGKYFGKTAQLLHICSACWKDSNQKAFHPAASVDCPLYEH